MVPRHIEIARQQVSAMQRQYDNAAKREHEENTAQFKQLMADKKRRADHTAWCLEQVRLANHYRMEAERS